MAADTERKNGDPVEVALDYLNDLIYGGDPTRREELRPRAVKLAARWERTILADMIRQFEEKRIQPRNDEVKNG